VTIYHPITPQPLHPRPLMMQTQKKE